MEQGDSGGGIVIYSVNRERGEYDPEYTLLAILSHALRSKT